MVYSDLPDCSIETIRKFLIDTGYIKVVNGYDFTNSSFEYWVDQSGVSLITVPLRKDNCIKSYEAIYIINDQMGLELNQVPFYKSYINNHISPD